MSQHIDKLKKKRAFQWSEKNVVDTLTRIGVGEDSKLWDGVYEKVLAMLAPLNGEQNSDLVMACLGAVKERMSEIMDEGWIKSSGRGAHRERITYLSDDENYVAAPKGAVLSEMSKESEIDSLIAAIAFSACSLAISTMEEWKGPKG